MVFTGSPTVPDQEDDPTTLRDRDVLVGRRIDRAARLVAGVR
jgi:hypothetical protein